MKHFIILLFLVIVNWSYSQCFITKGLGGIYDDQANSIAVDNNGNFFISGSFRGTIDFDPGVATYTMTSSGIPSSIFVCKFDSNGNFVWAKKETSGSSSISIKKIVVDNSGSLYVAGSYSSNNITLGASIVLPNYASIAGTGSGSDCFVWKLDNNGVTIWAKHYGGTGDDVANSIALDNNGYFYLTGYFSGTADFDPGVTTAILTSAFGGKDIFVVKISTNTGLIGGTTWYRSIGGASSDEAKSISIDGSGNIYITGHYSQTVDFDPGAGVQSVTSNGGTQDVFIAKLSTTGLLTWVASIGGNQQDIVNGMAIDNLGNVYITGTFLYTLDFDPSASTFNLTPLGGTDIYINKLDANGNFVWAKKSGGSGNDEGLSIAIDNLGNSYTTGFYAGISDFDPGNSIYNLTSTAGTSNDIFLWELDGNGNFVGAKSYGGVGEDRGLAILADNSGNVYSAGFFSNTADFDPGVGITNLISNGLKDIYIQKIGSLPVPSISINGPTTFCQNSNITLTSSSGSSYLWSNGSTTQQITTNVAGNYSVIVTYANGCSNATATTSVTVNSLPTLNISSTNTLICVGETATITANSSASTYSWSNGSSSSSIIVTPSVTTIYTISVSNGLCNSNSSYTQSVSVCTSLNELKNNSIKIYPNPASAELTISSPIKFTDVKIVNSIGQIVQESKYNNTVSIAELSSGIYFLQLFNENGNLLKIAKFIKE